MVMRRIRAVQTGGRVCLMVAAVAVLSGCLHVKTDPIKVEPIHIVADINIRVERQLEDFFAFEKQADPTTTTPTVEQ